MGISLAQMAKCPDHLYSYSNNRNSVRRGGETKCPDHVYPYSKNRNSSNPLLPNNSPLFPQPNSRASPSRPPGGILS
ncbi:hypothetical protein SUGI_1481780 [Cryptomeria japonica]|uniref:Uncharacterized protein n=1 Tax=Cryptomeria japonica TaxID=3369 RepID=A0AAD3NTG3_CRYJA|nr:hypothetical protein SUGI_1455730 [Cryptomeria japonica]GLJ58879.1 hypothetical protein SUGI_1481780 [Cryptomeria japonica]